MFFYLQTEPNLYTVGFYDNNNKWRPDTDHPTREEAADRTAYLNGEMITKRHLPELIKAYARENGSEGTAIYRDIIIDLLRHATKTLSLSAREAIFNITTSAEEQFMEELSDALEGGSNT